VRWWWCGTIGKASCAGLAGGGLLMCAAGGGQVEVQVGGLMPVCAFRMSVQQAV
jgi:hypothetical protein